MADDGWDKLKKYDITDIKSFNEKISQFKHLSRENIRGTRVPDISLILTADKATYQIGDTVLLTLLVQNFGTIMDNLILGIFDDWPITSWYSIYSYSSDVWRIRTNC